MIVVKSYRKYPRRIASVHYIINFIVFTRVGKGFKLSRKRAYKVMISYDKIISRLTQTEIINDSGQKLPKVKDYKGVHYCYRVHKLTKAFKRLR